jgi:hypothetical protein
VVTVGPVACVFVVVVVVVPDALVVLLPVSEAPDAPWVVDFDLLAVVVDEALEDRRAGCFAPVSVMTKTAVTAAASPMPAPRPQ